MERVFAPCAAEYERGVPVRERIKNKPQVKSCMGILHDIAQRTIDYISDSVRRFTAFTFIVVAVSVMIGMKVMMTGNVELQRLAWMVPVLLALLSYLYTEIAVIFFLIFAVIIMLL